MNATPATRQIVQYGLSEVYAAPNPQVDIVFVHGLNGHPHHTWATQKPENFWPADLLPSALEDQHVRILTYGYDANVAVFTDGASKDKIHNHAEHLASRLTANRSLKKATERPIIFVCHSLGGLVVKRCLIYCKSVRHAHTERLRSIYVSTYGILFLGTPHNGSDLAKWGTLLQSICAAVLPKKFFDTSPQLIEDLKTNNETLQNINRLFIEIIGRYRVYFFHESKPTDLKGTREFVVDEDSAAPVIEGVERMGIERDHSHMCKFEDENAPGYDVVAEAIQRYAEEAPPTIRKRWIEEKKIRDVERREAAIELLGDTVLQMRDDRTDENAHMSAGGHRTGGQLGGNSSLGGPQKSLSGVEHGTQFEYEFEEVEEKSSSAHPMKQIEAPPLENLGPLLIAPPEFRQNSLFYGFQFELDRLHVELSNQKKRSIGTSAVVLWGPPGCGKTHLAREYVWRHRDDFPSGIFWIDCKSDEAIHKSFWDTAQAAALLAPDHTEHHPDWDAASKYLEAVRKWFESREGWLIVFDGITLESEDDTLAFRKFIPDHKENSIIFTSVDRTLAKRQRLLYPSAVKVSPLTVEDAKQLLFNGLDIADPTPAQDTKATELVKYYECLPLAIHAIAHMLSANGKALEKYHIGTYPTSKRLAEPYKEIMKDLWENNHHEAIRLINLLSFFGHAVPVALIRLGKPALRDFSIEIRSLDREGSSRRDLETTIATLIKYGLVERTLQSYTSSLRSGSLRKQTSFATHADSSPELTQNGAEDEATRPDSSMETSSDRSITTSLDVIRVHTVVQGFCRDELKLTGKKELWRWLIPAVKLFCLSYTTAHDKIMAADHEGTVLLYKPALIQANLPTTSGLVRDYREYETHAARLHSHFPKDKSSGSTHVHKARHELREVMRMIKREIENRSPSQSFKSARRQIQVSIFERTSSTSSDGPDTPVSNPSRASTWTLEGHSKAESPTEIEHNRHEFIFSAADSDGESLPEDFGYQSGFDESLSSSFTTERRPSNPGVMAAGNESSTSNEGKHSRRSSFLMQAIFKGHPVKPKNHKDLGDWRPVPAPPSISHADIRAEAGTTSSRASSSGDRGVGPISAGSQAEAALAAVHRFSPPASRGGGRIRSPSRPSTADPETIRQPLAIRSPNLQSSSLALEFDPRQFDHHPRSTKNNSTTSTRHHSRHSTTASPPLLLANTIPIQKAEADNNKDLPPLPMTNNDISISHRIPPFNMQQALPTPLTRSDILPQRTEYIPTGYSSQPMSRDASHESAYSLATAPNPSGVSSLSPPQSDTYIHHASSPLSSSTNLNQNQNQLHRMGIGEWAGPPLMVTAPAPETASDGNSDSVVQFGDASPVNLVDARIRADEYARRLVPFEKGVYRPTKDPRGPVVAPPDRGGHQGGKERERESRDAEGIGRTGDGGRGEGGESTLHGLGMTFRW